MELGQKILPFATALVSVFNDLISTESEFRSGSVGLCLGFLATRNLFGYLISDASGGSNIHCEIVDSTDEGNQLLPGSPVYIGYPCVLSQDPTAGSSGTGYTYYSVIRVR